MTEIGERYVEQLLTTGETLRRRFVAYYDGVYFLGSKAVTAAERAKEVTEPVAYDLIDYTSAAVAVTEPVNNVQKETKNTIVELYLGISVLLLGLSCGQLAGAFGLPAVIEYVFDRYVEVAVLAMIPLYTYLNIRKNAAMDDVERRTILFGTALSVGIFIGHLIPSTTTLAPSVFFFPPLLLALLMDNELLVNPVSSMDRHTFFYLGGAASVLACTLAATIPLGFFSVAVLLLSSLHVAFLSFHFQIVMQCAKEKIMGVGESQFGYLVGLVFIQVVMSGMFGSNPYDETPNNVNNQ